MEQRISVITLGVADLDRSRNFYESLGWQPSLPNTDGIVSFQAGPIVFALFPREELAKDASLSPDGTGFNAISLAYNTRTRDEVNAVLSAATVAGATLLKPAHEAFWGGYSGYFSDPDGFLWEVAWNPQFHIADDGSIHLPHD
jgi:catechol 2,3-dioxygenase-like lactoylglutathione lyase family enzyme